MTMNLKVELDEQAWGKLIDLMTYAPYREVAPFLAAIHQQFQAQRENGNGSMATDGQALSERGATGAENAVGSRRN